MTQNDKFNYIIDGQMLDFVLSKGMQLMKIHKKLVYHKEPWLKSYIEFNQNKKNEVYEVNPKNPDQFKANFFKLLNNAFYDKTLENVEDRCNIKFTFNHPETFLKKTAKINYKRPTRFSENCVALHMTNSSTKYDKFNYIGFVVLELSKLQMYDFVYNHIEKYLAPNYKIHYTDTDSVILEIKCKFKERIEDKMKLLAPMLSAGDLGKYRDETKENEAIKRFVVNKAKSYSIETVDRVSCHGICKHVCTTKCKHRCGPQCKDECRQNYETIKLCNHECNIPHEHNKLKVLPHSSYKHIHHDDYRDVVTGDRDDIYVDTVRIQSKNHHIYVRKQHKLALNTFDDKRYICSDGITTYPFGYTKKCGGCGEMLNLILD